MNGTSILNASTSFVANVPGTSTIVGTGDFNGDGRSDILWRDTSGNVAIWEMNGTTILKSGDFVRRECCRQLVGVRKRRLQRSAEPNPLAGGRAPFRAFLWGHDASVLRAALQVLSGGGRRRTGLYRRAYRRLSTGWNIGGIVP
jgi:hypothetical protein